MGMDALAITDHCNMYGALDFYLKAKKSDIKPIIGCETYVAPGSMEEKTKRGAYHLILLARNVEGYQNLIKLVSFASLKGFYYRPRIDKELLAQHSKGLIGLTACLGGEVPRAFREGGYSRAEGMAAQYRDLFEKDSFYLEIQSNGYPEQVELNQALRRIGNELGLPLVATNDVHYLHADDAHAHELLMCIQTGHTLDDPKRNKMHSDQLFLKTRDQMIAAMPDFQDAIERTREIVERCNLEIDLSQTYLPDFPIPEGHTYESYLAELSHQGLGERLAIARSLGKEINEKIYLDRLETELDIILGMGYAGYYLIVWDFINEAKRRGIPVGPGRGSGAGSVVAWAIRITDLDPVEYGLLFERFLNPERVSMPDFDVDFCRDRRDEVIKYVSEKYGAERVGQIATFHQLKSRSVVRDVGRAMGVPIVEVNRITKLLPEPGPAGDKITIHEAIAKEPRLKAEVQGSPKVREMLDYAARLVGLHRHVGMHAAGVVIAPRCLWEHVPVFKGQNGELVTQYDKDFSEKVGLVKFDFLGLKTMTIIDKAAKLVNRRSDRDEPLDMSKVPLDDSKTYDLISSGETTYVFQMESRGFRELIRRLAPDKFEEIVALLALYRPGPLKGGMVDDFVERKHGRQEISYLDSRLENVLKETYGIIVYQEQVMKAAQVLAGFTLGAADIMRRAMGKKKFEVMAEQRRKFVEGCAVNQITDQKANEIFDLIDKFAGYGFNKSHSAAYAVVSYHTAWLKAHYPVEFLAANLTCDSDDSDRVAFLIAEGRANGIRLLPPDVNGSELFFTVEYSPEGPGSIRFGLGALKGVGQAGLEAVLEAREEGPFRDLFDFCSRVDLRRVNKSMLEVLVKGGAFDSTMPSMGVHRARVAAAVEAAIERGKAAQRDRASGQGSLFDLLEPDESANVSLSGAIDYPDVPPWESQQNLAAERDALGIYLSGHPLDPYASEIRTLAEVTVAQVASRRNSVARLCGVVERYQEKPLKSGSGRMATFHLEDLTGRVEVYVPPKLVAEFSETLQRTDPIICKAHVRLEGEEETARLRLESVISVREWRQSRYTQIHLNLQADEMTDAYIGQVREIVSRNPGRCLLVFHLTRPGAWEAVVQLPDRYRLDPSERVLGELRTIPGILSHELRF
jgi:DNA polymerase-3 subunit alpha